MKKATKLFSITMVAVLSLSSANIMASEISKDVLAQYSSSAGDRKAVFDALENVVSGCANVTDHEHIEGSRSVTDRLHPLAYLYDSADSKDYLNAAGEIILSDEEIPQFQLLLLIESLGEFDPVISEALIRTIYDNAETLATNMHYEIVAPEGVSGEEVDRILAEESDLAPLAINSNLTDIKIALIFAIQRSNTDAMDDIILYESQGSDRAAELANGILLKKSG